MTSKYDNKQWGVVDFKRYHAGMMPAEERHALEKAALDDPFLDDALEGYAFGTHPEKQIAELRLSLAAEKNKKTSKVVWYRQNQPSKWVKIAAALILFAGFAWLLYPNMKDKPVEIASNTKPAESAEKTLPPSLQLPVDSTVSPHAAVRDEVKEVTPLATVPAPTKRNTKPVTPDDISMVDIKEETSDRDQKLLAQNRIAFKDEVKNIESDQAISRMKMEAVMPAIANVITGTVVDMQGKPVPYAVLTAPALNSNVATDAHGKFILPNSTNLQVVQADVNAVGFEKSNSVLSANNSSNKIVLQESGNALSEVVVVGYGTTKKSVAPTAPAPEKLKAAPVNDYRVILKNGKPLESWEEFNESVTTQIKTNKFVDTTGVVVLSFDIDNNGAAQNISVVKKLCATCDEQAKKILQNAPAMKRVKPGKKVEAVIRF